MTTQVPDSVRARARALLDDTDAIGRGPGYETGVAKALAVCEYLAEHGAEPPIEAWDRDHATAYVEALAAWAVGEEEP